MFFFRFLKKQSGRFERGSNSGIKLHTFMQPLMVQQLHRNLKDKKKDRTTTAICFLLKKSDVPSSISISNLNYSKHVVDEDWGKREACMFVLQIFSSSQSASALQEECALFCKPLWFRNLASEIQGFTNPWLCSLFCIKSKVNLVFILSAQP